jgi:hypothetical protein
MLPTPQLRPQTLGDILDNTLRLYRNNFVTFLGIAAVLLVPLSILRLLFALLAGPDVLNQTEQLPGMPNIPFFQWFMVYSTATGSGLASLLSLLQSIVLGPLMVAALIYATAQRFLGRPAAIADSLRFGLRGARFLLVLASQLLIYIGLAIALVVPFLCLFAGVLASTVGFGAAVGGGGDDLGAGLGIVAGLLMFLLIAALFIAAVYLGTRLLFFAQAIVIEGTNPIDAITRSWRLVASSVWRTFGIYFVLNLLVGLVTLAIFVLLAFVAAGLGLAFDDPTGNFGLAISLIELVQLLTSLLLQPVLYIGATLLYYDLRVRKEGLDLELQSAATPPAPLLNA